jgi:hypothetical protein
MVENMPVLSEWLESFNQRMGREAVPHIGRPMRAWSEWQQETGESFGFDHPKAKQIFQWFDSRSPAGSLCHPSVFTGAFYFDAYFWPVRIQITYSAQMLEPRDALSTMPPSTKERLYGSPDDLENFNTLWADCLDYGYGLRELNLAGSPTDFWQCLAVSGDYKLRSAVKDLCEPGGANAMQSSRESCEMFLKAFLARYDGLTEEDAKNPKKFGHDLSKLLVRILQIKPDQIFSEASGKLSSFPNVEDRYASRTYGGLDLWNAYKVAQAVAAEVIRTFTKRNTGGESRPGSSAGR